MCKFLCVVSVLFMPQRLQWLVAAMVTALPACKCLGVVCVVNAIEHGLRGRVSALYHFCYLQGVGGPCCARILTTWFASKVRPCSRFFISTHMHICYSRLQMLLPLTNQWHTCVLDCRSLMYRVGQNHIFMVHTRYIWQGNHQIYGHIRCVNTVLANPNYVR